MGVCVQRGLCPEGSLSRGVSVQWVSVQGSLSRGLCPGRSLSMGSLSSGVSVRETPVR